MVVNDNGADVNGGGEDHGPADDVVAEITAAGGIAVADYNTVATEDGGAAIVPRRSTSSARSRSS